MNASFSVGAWAYSNGGGGVILSKHLFDIDTNPPWGKYTGYVLGNMNGAGLRLEIVNDHAGHGPGCPCGFRVSAPTEPIYNEWFHIIGVFESGQSVKLYVNGEEVAQTSTSATSINNTNRRNPTYFYKIGKPWSSLGVLSHAIERDQIHSSLITCQVFHGLPFILNIMVLKLLTATNI